MTRRCLPLLSVLLLCAAAQFVRADVGDPQVRTDHPWYAGELSCSNAWTSVKVGGKPIRSK